MKILTVILIVVLFLTSCRVNEDITTYKHVIISVDSTGVTENPASPGTFLTIYDTIKIEVTDKWYHDRGAYKKTYKLIKK